MSHRARSRLRSDPPPSYHSVDGGTAQNPRTYTVPKYQASYRSAQGSSTIHPHSSTYSADGCFKSIPTKNRYNNVNRNKHQRTPLFTSQTFNYGSVPPAPVKYDTHDRDVRILLVALVFVLGISIREIFFSPLTSYWTDVSSSEVCHSPGAREYSATLLSIPWDWSRQSACRGTAIDIGGKSFKSPHSCETRGGTVIGKWIVENDDSCTPIWSSPTPGICHTFHSREYSAELVYVPEGLSLLHSCQKTPLFLHGMEILPLQCHVEMRSGNGVPVTVKGTWVVDSSHLDQDIGCTPVWSDIAPEGCTSYATRAYTAELSVVPPGLDPLLSCRQTPAVIHGRNVLPSECRSEAHGDSIVMRGRWLVDFDEPQCTPTWKNVVVAERCHSYRQKPYSAALEDIPVELDPLATCREAPLYFENGWVSLKPMSCEEREGRIIGTWQVDFGHPECTTVLKDIDDHGCPQSNLRRIEATVEGIGRESWFDMCITTPLQWHGNPHLPTQCERRRKVFRDFVVAIYEMTDTRCGWVKTVDADAVASEATDDSPVGRLLSIEPES